MFFVITCVTFPHRTKKKSFWRKILWGKHNILCKMGKSLTLLSHRQRVSGEKCAKHLLFQTPKQIVRDSWNFTDYRWYVLPLSAFKDSFKTLDESSCLSPLCRRKHKWPLPLPSSKPAVRKMTESKTVLFKKLVHICVFCIDYFLIC